MGEGVKDEETKPKSLTIGFAGSDNYDLLLYFACLLKALHYRILLIDLSEERALTASVSGQIDETSGDILDANIDIMEFNGLDYFPYMKDDLIRTKVCGPYLYHEKNEYDYVLVDYGRMMNHPAFCGSDFRILISDLQRQHLSLILSPNLKEDKTLYYIIRDIIACKFRPKDLLPEKFLEQKTVFLLDFDPGDAIHRLKIQYSRQLSLTKLSDQTKRLLTSLLDLLSLPTNQKEFAEGIMKTRRRRF